MLQVMSISRLPLHGPLHSFRTLVFQVLILLYSAMVRYEGTEESIV